MGVDIEAVVCSGIYLECAEIARETESSVCAPRRASGKELLHAEVVDVIFASVNGCATGEHIFMSLTEGAHAHAAQLCQRVVIVVAADGAVKQFVGSGDVNAFLLGQRFCGDIMAYRVFRLIDHSHSTLQGVDCGKKII